MMHGIIGVFQMDANPLTRMQTVGNVILDAVGTIMVAKVAVDVLVPEGRIASSLAKFAPGKAGKFLGALNPGEVGSTAIFAIFGFGMFLAIVLPLIPYVLWTLGIFSWMVSCVIAITATPIWIAAHASPEGHEVSGSGTNGYPILLGLLLRPVLMTMGVFMAILLMYVGDFFLSKTFMTAFSLANSSNIIGPFIMLGGIMMYCTLTLMLVYSSFRIIQTLPDAILSWIGGRSDDAVGVGEHSEKAQGMLIAGFGNAKGAVGQAMAPAKGKEGESGGKDGAKKDTKDKNEGLISKGDK